MTKKSKLLPIVLILLLVGAVTAFALKGHIAVFEPAGTIAAKERNLMVFTLLLSVFVVVPVFVMTFFIVWRYRADAAEEKRREYRPDWDRNKLIESIWWGIPCLIILVLAVVTWRATHELDPYRPLSTSKKPLTVQVVALQWKWLFIYPEQNIATVNYLQIPEDTPINFEITSDAPMNSFWIPRLGGQVYAMEGMTSKLHLMADEPGMYTGSSANLSGKGFAGMDFTVRSSTERDFMNWVETAKQTRHHLTMTEYTKLAKPSEHNPHYYYSTVTSNLYGTIVNKFMAHEGMSY